MKRVFLFLLVLSLSATASAMAVEATAVADGFVGPVAVAVTFDQTGTILSLTVGDEDFAETPGLGALALEEDFTSLFLGLVPPLSLEDIDVIAAATITTEAVIEAVNLAYESLFEAATVITVQGFVGPISVAVTFDEEGAITSLAIDDEDFVETPGLGALALEEDFISQFIGLVPPLSLEDIDAIAAATITTEAVIDAINQASGQ